MPTIFHQLIDDRQRLASLPSEPPSLASSSSSTRLESLGSPLMESGKEQNPSRLQIAHAIMKITVPQSIALLAWLSTATTNVFFIGRLGDETSLGAVGFATLVFNVCGLSVGYGLNAALDTLIPHSRGFGDRSLAMTYLNRAQLVGSLWAVIVTILLSYTETLLLFCGQSPEISRLAAEFVLSASWGLWAAIQFDALCRFMIAYDRSTPVMLVFCLAALLHIVWCSYLTPLWGMQGVGIAQAITYWTYLGLLCSYLAVASSFAEWKHPFRMQAFAQWGEFFRVALPSCGMMCLQWWSFEFCALFVGALHSPAQLAAHVSLCNFQQIITMIPLGMQRACATVVGTALGKGDIAAVRESIRLSVILTAGVIVVTISFVFAYSDSIALFYARSDSQLMVRDLLKELLPILVIAESVDIFQWSIGGVFKGLGIPDQPAYANLACYYAVLLPLSFFLCNLSGWGVAGVWVSFGLSSWLVTALLTLMLSRVDLWRLSALSRERSALAAEVGYACSNSNPSEC